MVAAVMAAMLKQVRCPNCGYRLWDWNVNLRPGEIVTTKCRGCKQLVTIIGQDDD